MNGQLAVSRAFGDKSLKSHLRSDPDIQNTNIDISTDILVLASDGLWKVMHFFLNSLLRMIRAYLLFTHVHYAANHWL